MPGEFFNSTVAVWRNPIALAHGRPQLRWKGTAAWAIVTVSVVAFIFLIAYLTLAEREVLAPVLAAKAALVPLIVVQCVLLMGMGTAAVAGGIAKDREAGTLDYHRMTPMPAFEKILGYLFGLPARQYFLFALTLPFLGYAVWRGEIAPGKVLHFYVVFFSSVWMYHLFGLMVGMVAKRPRNSTLASSGLVAMLYLVMPGLARVGLSFLDFLTVRPTFYGMVAAEVEVGELSRHMEALSSRYAAVQFYGLELNPTLFTLIVQGLAITALLHVVRRKWTDPSWHAFSKRFGLLFFTAVCVLLVGSLWPHVQGRAVYDRLNLQTLLNTDGGALFSLTAVFCGVAAAMALLTVSLVTPSAVTTRRGLRRARKAGRTRVPAGSDAASSLPVTLGVLAVGMVALAVAAWGWSRGDRGPLNGEMWWWVALVSALAGGVLLTFQGLHERLGRGAVILLLFLGWAVPFMVAMVLVTAFQMPEAALYAAVPCAPVMGAVGLLEMATAFGEGQLERFLREELPVARFSLMACVGLYGGLAAVVQGMRWGWMRGVKRGEASG